MRDLPGSLSIPGRGNHGLSMLAGVARGPLIEVGALPASPTLEVRSRSGSRHEGRGAHLRWRAIREKLSGAGYQIRQSDRWSRRNVPYTLYDPVNDQRAQKGQAKDKARPRQRLQFPMHRSPPSASPHGFSLGNVFRLRGGQGNSRSASPQASNTEAGTEAVL